MGKDHYFKTLLLDLDGTLVDSKRLIISSIKFAVRKKGRKVPTTRSIKEQVRIRSSPTRVLGHFKIWDAGNYWEFYQSHLQKLRLLDSRLKRKLQRISDAGAEIGLVTSLPGKIAKSILEHFKITKFFSTVRSAQWMTPKWKLIDRAIRDLHTEKDDLDRFKVLYVGDRASDIRAASKAGKSSGIWSGLAYWSGQRLSEFRQEEPDFVFRKFDELVELFMSRITKEEDCFTPSRECYSLNTPYLRKKLRINRTSCNYCQFPADCLNCARFDNVSDISPRESYFTDLSDRIGVTARSCEWYYPRNYTAEIANEDSKDTRNVLANFKNGYNYYKFRLGLSLARHFKKFSRQLKAFRGIDLIIPVPSTKKKIRKRGYNPSEELAKMLGKIERIPVISDCLDTTSKRSRRQTRYSHDWVADKERLMRNIQVHNKGRLARKKILLIDDVLTDGVTLAAYSEKLLREVKPRPKVAALTFGLTFKER